jgi:hypothetical protein
VTLALAFRSSAQEAQAAQRARAAVVNTINQLRRGEPLRLDSIRRAVQAVPGVYPTGNEIIYPIGDVFPRSLEVLRSALTFVQSNVPLSDQYGYLPAVSGSGTIVLS